MKELLFAKKIGAKDFHGRIYHQMGLLFLEMEKKEVPFLICIFRALKEILILKNRIEILSISEQACSFFMNQEHRLRNYLPQHVIVGKFCPQLNELLNNTYSISESEVIDCVRVINNVQKMTTSQILDIIYKYRLYHTYYLSIQLQMAKELDSVIYERTIIEKEKLGIICQ